MAILTTMTTALFPGSFDPFTDGHRDIALRGLRLFDRVVVAVGVNPDKSYMFSVQERMQRIADLFANEPRLTVCHYSDLTVQCCRRHGATVMLRGIRNAADLEYEQMVASVNRQLDPTIETLLLLAAPGLENVSSTLARQLLAQQQH